VEIQPFNQEYRNAIIETISATITADEITGIISDINEYLNSLENYDRLVKTEPAERTINKLEALNKIH